MIFGLDAAPDLETVEATTDGQSRCVEGHELIVFGSGFLATDPADKGRGSIDVGSELTA